MLKIVPPAALCMGLGLLAAPPIVPAEQGKWLPPNPARSMRFAPMVLKLTGGGGGRALGKLASISSPADSTAHVRVEGNLLYPSRAWVRVLAGGVTGPHTAQWVAGTLRDRFGITAVPAGRLAAVYTPTDPLYDSLQWNMENTGQTIRQQTALAGTDVHVAPVWDGFGGADSLVVAIVDAGIHTGHPEFAGRIWSNRLEAGGAPGVDDDGNGYVDDVAGWDFADDDPDPMDYVGHGSGVSGIVAANMDNEMGIAGIWTRGRVMALRVLNSAGYGVQSDIAEAIVYAVDNGAHVVNLSLGGDDLDAVLQDALDYAGGRGIPVVMSAGNASRDLDAVRNDPGFYSADHVIRVAAHDPAGALAEFSSYGRRTVQLAAPGQAIVSAGIPNKRVLTSDGFESLAGWTSSREGGFVASASDPLAGENSLVWQAGRNVALVRDDWIDLGDARGATLGFALEYQPGGTWDALIVEGRHEGEGWREIAFVSGAVSPAQWLQFTLRQLEGNRFQLRFRLESAPFFSFDDRAVKIDGLLVTAMDPDPGQPAPFRVVDGTSVSAPHVAAYLGLLRLACDRSGVPMDMERIRAGVAADARLEDLTTWGGRLDIQKGLGFFLSGLPRLVVTDSAVSSWASGESVIYRFGLSGPSEGYALRASQLPPGAEFDSTSGLFSWTVPQVGSHRVVIEAEGAGLLRRSFSFHSEGATVAIRPPMPAGWETVVGQGPLGGRDVLGRLRPWWEGSPAHRERLLVPARP